MHYFKALRTISLILGFVLVTFGCATSKLVSSKNQAENKDFGLTAETAPDGILLSFSNIPSDAVRLFIHVSYWDKDEYDNSYNIISSNADIRDISLPAEGHHSIQLDKVKKTGKALIPIVHAGKKYRICAIPYNLQEHESLMNDIYYFKPGVETELIAENGLIFNKDSVKLELNNINSTLTLSAEPVFPSELLFCPQKYNFGILVTMPEGSVSKWTHHIPDGLSSDGLSWTFEPQMTDEYSNVDFEWLKNGNSYTAWGIAEVNIIYDDITWSIQIAKTPEFTYSL